MRHYAAVRALMLWLVALLTGCAPASGAVPQAAAPRSTPMPYRTATAAPSRTPTCNELKPVLCQDLAALIDEAGNETLPLCRVKSPEWCVEQLVGLGKRARSIDPVCNVVQQNAAGDLFREMALLYPLPPGEARDEAIEKVEEAYVAFAEACDFRVEPTPTK